jgi:hypothetical protein
MATRPALPCVPRTTRRPVNRGEAIGGGRDTVMADACAPGLERGPDATVGITVDQRVALAAWVWRPLRVAGTVAMLGVGSLATRPSRTGCHLPAPGLRFLVPGSRVRAPG